MTANASGDPPNGSGDVDETRHKTTRFFTPPSGGRSTRASTRPVGQHANAPASSSPLRGRNEAESDLAPDTPRASRVKQLVDDPSNATAVAARLVAMLDALSTSKATKAGHSVAVDTAKDMCHLARMLQRSVVSTAKTQHQEVIAAIHETNAKINEIAETITSGKHAATYADAVKDPSPPKRSSQRQNRAPRHLEHELLLRLKANSGPHPLANLTPVQMLQKLNDTLNKTPGLSGGDQPTISSILRLASGDVRITAVDTASITKLKQNDQWLTALAGDKLRYTKPLYYVVAHRVNTDFSWTTTESYTDWVVSNQTIHGTVDHMKWLRNIENMTNKPTHATLKIAFTNLEDANFFIRNGLAFEGEICPVEKARRPPLRCLNCYRHGHTQARCRSPTRCGTCGTKEPTDGHDHCSDHEHADDCETTCPPLPKCAACGDPEHKAFDRTCPHTVAAERAARDEHFNSGLLYPTADNAEY
jgi:hypothetical protein